MENATITSICVFCSASDRIDGRYFDLAHALGKELAQRKLTLVYGGGGVGLMGALARAASERNGRIVGVIPDFMREKELAFEEVDELVVTTTMRERKAEMELRSDAFIVLPGGFGTLEEVVEIITLKQLALHHKPIIFINECGFFEPLMTFFEQIFNENFAHPRYRSFFRVADTLEETFHYLETYPAGPAENHWHVTT